MADGLLRESKYLEWFPPGPLTAEQRSLAADWYNRMEGGSYIAKSMLLHSNHVPRPGGPLVDGPLMFSSSPQSTAQLFRNED